MRLALWLSSRLALGLFSPGLFSLWLVPRLALGLVWRLFPLWRSVLGLPRWLALGLLRRLVLWLFILLAVVGLVVRGRRMLLAVFWFLWHHDKYRKASM